MNRRQFVVTAAASSALVVLGCESDNKPSHTATLLNNPEVQDALRNLTGAVGTLQGDVGRFDGENWRDVVPDVESAAESVESALGELKKALGVDRE